MKKTKKKSNKKPFFRLIKSIVKLFKRKPSFLYTHTLPQKASIYVSNHAASSGPINYELYFPKNFQMMGAYQMCEGFKSRFNYMYQIYFCKKKKMAKPLSFVLAILLTPLMVMFYKGMQIIPIYPDSRFRKTIEMSIKKLKKDINLMIFPENSDDGYHDKLKQFYTGFWVLAQEYHKRTGNDIDIVSTYYNNKTKQIIFGKPKSYLELKKLNYNRHEIAKIFLEETNSLYENSYSA